MAKAKSFQTVIGKKPLRIAFAHLLEPEEFNGKTNYSCLVIIPKDDEDTLDRVKGIVKQAKEAFKAANGGKLPKDFRNPLRDGSEKDEYEGFEDSYFISVKSKFPPNVQIKKNGQYNDVVDPDDIYSGMYARLAIGAFSYNEMGNSGVGLNLSAVVKMKEGEPFTGGDLSATFSEFDDDEGPDNESDDSDDEDW